MCVGSAWVTVYTMTFLGGSARVVWAVLHVYNHLGVLLSASVCYMCGWLHVECQDPPFRQHDVKFRSSNISCV